LTTLAFRLSGGAAAALAKLAGTCVEIVFAGMGLCDRLIYAFADHAETRASAANRVNLVIGASVGCARHSRPGLSTHNALRRYVVSG
jgi:hypothetical protein